MYHLLAGFIPWLTHPDTAKTIKGNESTVTQCRK